MAGILHIWLFDGPCSLSKQLLSKMEVFTHGATVRTAVAYLTAGQVYKLSIAYGQSIYGQLMNFQFRGPKESESSSIFSSSGEGLFFHCTPTNGYGNDCAVSPPSANVAATDLTAGLSFDVCYYGYFDRYRCRLLLIMPTRSFRNHWNSEVYSGWHIIRLAWYLLGV